MNPATMRTVRREAARVLLMRADGRVLLFLFRYTPADGVERNVWITPGGGVEAGETFEEAAARELWEESGLRTPLGPCIWTRAHTSPWRDFLIEQHERIYFARVDSAEVDIANQNEYERELMPEHRWWSAAEVAASDAYFAPQSLATLLPQLVAGDLPAEPLDVND